MCDESVFLVGSKSYNHSLTVFAAQTTETLPNCEWADFSRVILEDWPIGKFEIHQVKMKKIQKGLCCQTQTESKPKFVKHQK